jgi:site-specific DNA-methyltransferase (adenine-specific)
MTTPYYEDDLVTLYHGDCREVTEWLEADVLVTDPPYGSQGLAGSYGRRNGTVGRVIANDLTTEARDAALSAWGGVRAVACFGTPRLPDPPGEWTDRLVWDKREPGINGGAWRYVHESIFVRGEGWHRPSPSSFSIISVPSGNGTPEKSDHVHAKPVLLMHRLLEAAPPGAIADPFSGSGSTLLAAKLIGRRAIGVEIEERYCEIAAKRLAQDTLFGGVA